MKRIAGLILFGAVLVSIAGCGKPSVENETNKYNQYQRNLKQLSVKYPGLRSFMVIIANEAYQIMLEAQKIQVATKKAEKIAEANQVFSQSSLYYQLNSMDNRFEFIKKMQKELLTGTGHQDKAAFTQAISQSSRALAEAEGIIKNAKPADMEAAVGEVKKANEVLINAEYQLKHLPHTKG